MRRRYFAYPAELIDKLSDEWSGLKSIIAIETISSKTNDTSANKVHASWRYYLSSHVANNNKIAQYIRNHWSIENKLHWILDVNMKEDDDQKAERKSARSFALLKRIALNILRAKPEVSTKKQKTSMRRRLKKAGWDNDYLLDLLR